MRPLTILSLSCGAGFAVAQAPADSRAGFADVTAQDVREYAVTLHVDVANGRLVGDVRYTIAAVERLETVRLDARRSDAWQVTFAGSDGRELPASWQDDAVVLALPTAVEPGGEVRFTAHLEGAPVDGFYFRDNRYGERMAFTDHYSIRARGWLPCEDNPADRAAFSLLLNYPEGLEAIAFGATAEPPAGAEPPPEGFRSLFTRGASEIPPYMFAVTIGPLARVAEAGDPRLVDHLVYRRDVDKAQPMLTQHAEWMAMMSRTFGDYAYAKYTTVQCPTRWGGFEAPGNVQLAEGLFDDPRGVGTLAHELVHMWFGDAVGYAEWREVWLSEGFASYFGPWLRAETGGQPLADSMAGLRARWLSSFEGRTKTVRDDTFPHPDQALNANTYPKGAWVLHMLRQELGEEAFFGALRAYYTKHRGRSVRTVDFVADVERHTGKELGWFFAQWLDRVGCPELRVTPADGGLVVEQVQKGEPYRFRLRLRTGPAEMRIDRRVRVEGARTFVPIDGPLGDVELDPEVELLFRPAR